eukprot:gnl/TRDRNA2_/TRDRNA2_174889_c0_seq5.p1 gnl/TRDRNA2_/TRDRNA2_174889_c0~~gnl/TRDRNA2_/TRDRNA2_174889_c0_seq5.p1  ORF type:complete len:463 (+),score=49.37 gnl/TRDRNA2_/TRDRNA2_174889_c0_seq5:124-1512(+)
MAMTAMIMRLFFACVLVAAYSEQVPAEATSNTTLTSSTSATTTTTSNANPTESINNDHTVSDNMSSTSTPSSTTFSTTSEPHASIVNSSTASSTATTSSATTTISSTTPASSTDSSSSGTNSTADMDDQPHAASTSSTPSTTSSINEQTTSGANSSISSTSSAPSTLATSTTSVDGTSWSSSSTSSTASAYHVSNVSSTTSSPTAAASNLGSTSVELASASTSSTTSTSRTRTASTTSVSASATSTTKRTITSTSATVAPSRRTPTVAGGLSLTVSNVEAFLLDARAKAAVAHGIADIAGVEVEAVTATFERSARRLSLRAGRLLTGDFGSIEVSYTIDVPSAAVASAVVAALSSPSTATVTKSIQQQLAASQLDYEASVVSLSAPSVLTTATATTTGELLLVSEETALALDALPINPIAGGLIGGTIILLLLGSAWCMNRRGSVTGREEQQKFSELPHPTA